MRPIQYTDRMSAEILHYHNAKMENVSTLEEIDIVSGTDDLTHFRCTECGTKSRQGVEFGEEEREAWETERLLPWLYYEDWEKRVLVCLSCLQKALSFLEKE